MNADFEYMKEALATDLSELLSKDYNMSISEAIDTLYNSETFARLQNADTGLYYQSPGYVYSFLNSELSFCDYRK